MLEEDGLRFKVVDLEGSRIERLEVEFLPEPALRTEDEEETAAGNG